MELLPDNDREQGITIEACVIYAMRTMIANRCIRTIGGCEIAAKRKQKAKVDKPASDSLRWSRND